MAHIPENFHDLLTREKRAFVYLAIILSGGSPHVSPVWFDWDGKHFIFNTARGRLKDKAMSKRRAIAFVVADPNDPYRYLSIRGHVVEETEEGAYEMICSLNEKYHGKYEFPKHPGQVRVTYKVAPEKVFADE